MSSFLKVFLTACLFWGACVNEADAKTLKIGVTAGPHIDILKDLQKRAEVQGLQIELVEFNDFILPNIALSEGSIDANIYQHDPFLKDQCMGRGYELTSLGNTILLPMGVYAHKLQKIEDLPRTGKVAIPNDPTNGGRALLLLQQLGLIKLKEDAPENPSVIDIAENPHHLKIVEVEAPQLPRSLEDVDMAVINTDWVLVAGLDPSKALASESKDSPYANLLVVRTVDKDNPDLLKFKALYQSPETKKFIEDTFKGAVLAAW